MYILQIILVMFGRVLEVAVFARNVRRFGACRKGKLGRVTLTMDGDEQQL